MHYCIDRFAMHSYHLVREHKAPLFKRTKLSKEFLLAPTTPIADTKFWKQSLILNGNLPG